jgi:hypothetical protein
VPGLNKVIDRVDGKEMKLFIEGSILYNKDAYHVDSKSHMVFKHDNQGLPGRMPSDLPTYALYHLHKHETSAAQASTLDQAALVFCDLSPAETSTSFILSLNERQRQQLKKEL